MGVAIMQPAHRFLGEWTLDPERSQYQYGALPRSITLTIEPHADALLVRMAIVGNLGSPITVDGLWPFGEGERNATDIIDERTLVHRIKHDGAVTSTMRHELSEDGLTMTVRHEGEAEDGRWVNLSVFVRRAV